MRPELRPLPLKTKFLLYTATEWDVSEEIFEELERRDEHRLENMEYYSNILYVKENTSKLSLLAHKAHTTDKYREETCCIIGHHHFNIYSTLLLPFTN